MTAKESDRVLVGVIIGAHGIRGEVKIKSFTEDPLGITQITGLCFADGKNVKFVKPRFQKSIIYTRLDGVDDRNQAETLKGAELFTPREKLPETEEDDYYHADLIGLNVVSVNGDQLGVVTSVHNFGAGDLLEVGAHLIPFTHAHVPEVNLDAGQISVILPVFTQDDGLDGPTSEGDV